MTKLPAQMPIKVRLIVSVIFFWFFLATSRVNGEVGIIVLDGLVEWSSEIVIGQVERVTEVASERTARLRVSHVLKGDLTTGQAIRIRADGTWLCDTTDARSGEWGLYFLISPEAQARDREKFADYCEEHGCFPDGDSFIVTGPDALERWARSNTVPDELFREDSTPRYLIAGSGRGRMLLCEREGVAEVLVPYPVSLPTVLLGSRELPEDNTSSIRVALEDIANWIVGSGRVSRQNGIRSIDTRSATPSVATWRLPGCGLVDVTAN